LLPLICASHPSNCHDVT